MMDSGQEHQGGPQLQAVHIFHHAFRRGGGMERYAIALASAMKTLGRSVVVHTMKAEEGLAQSMGVGLDFLPVARFPRKLQAFRFFRQIERVRRNARGLQITLSRARAQDIAVCGGTHRGYLARARKWAGPFDLLQLWMEKESYRQGRIVVAHSDFVARDLVERYDLPPEKIRTLYPPLDDRFKPSAQLPSREELREKLGWPASKIVFLFPSKGHSNKGLKPICEALKAFSDTVHLAVVGRLMSRFREPFISYLGYIEDMAGAYRAADFTILGSYYEAFGLVGPESIMCGTRLIFEENIGCLPVIEPEYVFTFSVRDPQSVRQALARAIALAREGRHHFDDPLKALRYDTSPLAHAKALLLAAGDHQAP